MFNVYDPHVQRDRLPDEAEAHSTFPIRRMGSEALVTVDDVGPWPWQGIDTPEQRVKIAGYYNCVHRVDIAVGMLMELLEEKGDDENALMSFSRSGLLYPRQNQLLRSRITGAVYRPLAGRFPASRFERLVGSIDIYPTVLDAVGSSSGKLHGRSLSPCWRKTTEPTGRTPWLRNSIIRSQSLLPRRAITDGRYKLIYNILGGEAGQVTWWTAIKPGT